uniref:Secreted protein n=1 Tax=Mycena chlorophos TaxID=658473 RepID=A0ABQ0LK92_MYCCL|nr:predicted protein [Mycena chlorophos]
MRVHKDQHQRRSKFSLLAGFRSRKNHLLAAMSHAAASTSHLQSSSRRATHLFLNVVLVLLCETLRPGNALVNKERPRLLFFFAPTVNTASPWQDNA